VRKRLIHLRRWGVAVLAGVTVLGAVSTIGIEAASAATPSVSVGLATGATAGTYLGTSGVGGVAGASLAITVTPSGVTGVVAGDTIDLIVACPAGGTIAPLVPTAVTALWTASVGATGACGVAANNEIILTAAAGAPTTISVAGITYTATNAPAGNLTLTSQYVNATGTSVGNAITDAVLGNVTTTPGPPESVIAPSKGDSAINNLTVTTPALTGPPANDAIPAGDFVCLTISGGTWDVINGVPTVTQANGASNQQPPAVVPATVPPTYAYVASLAGGGIQGTVLTWQTGTPLSTTNPSAYLLSNLHVDSPALPVGPPVVSSQSITTSVGFATSAANCAVPIDVTALSTGQPVYIDGVVPSGAIYGTTADQTVAQEYDAAFVTTSAAGVASCTNNGNAVISTDADPYDALSASYLEGQLGGGVLITEPTALDAATIAALQYAGVARVYIVGGLLAVDQADITALQATPAYTCGGLSKTGANIVVYSGISGAAADDTAVAIDNYISTGLANNLGTSIIGAYSNEATYNQTTGNESATAPVGTQSTAIVVSDTDWEDATAAAGIAWKLHVPVILTTPTALSADASGELTKLGITQVLALGGQLALTPAVVTSIQAITVNSAPIAVLRIAGADETQTAADLALFEGKYLGWAASTVLVAQGTYWSDALGAAGLSGSKSEPILLTDGPTSASVGTYLDAVLKTAGTLPAGLGSGVTAAIQVLGGPEAVTAAQTTEMNTALG
jgi:putative cell wall-binding protein